MRALRIGDVEREQASADLGEHLASGRLTPDEHAERLDALWTAKTEADLTPLFEDLPAPRPDLRVAAVSRPVGSTYARRPRPSVLLALGLLVLLVALTPLPVVVLALILGFVVVRRRGTRVH